MLHVSMPSRADLIIQAIVCSLARRRLALSLAFHSALAIIRSAAIVSSRTWRLYSEPGFSSICTSLWLSAKCLQALREERGLLPLTA